MHDPTSVDLTVSPPGLDEVTGVSAVLRDDDGAAASSPSERLIVISATAPTAMSTTKTIPVMMIGADDFGFCGGGPDGAA
ncbi:hypothetical protein [Gordonia iterans]